VGEQRRGEMRRTRRTGFSLLSLAVVLAAIVAGVGGCASVRNGLGTSSAVCFRAIPVGRSALGKPAPVEVPGKPGKPGNSQGTSTTSSSGAGSTTTSHVGSASGPETTKPGPNPVFVGVRSASQKDIEAFEGKHDSLVAELKTRNGGPLKSLCLVAFKGSFDPGSVHSLLGHVPNPGMRIFAIVVVSESSNKLLATFIRSREPISFTHYAVGG
jgi:hypothetical protein